MMAIEWNSIVGKRAGIYDQVVGYLPGEEFENILCIATAPNSESATKLDCVALVGQRPSNTRAVALTGAKEARRLAISVYDSADATVGETASHGTSPTFIPITLLTGSQRGKV